MPLPMARDVHTPAEPHAFVPAHVLEKSDEPTHTPRPPDQSIVQTDREQLGLAPDAFAIEHVEGIPHVGEEIIASREPAIFVESVVIGLVGVGDDEMRSAGDVQPIGQLVGKRVAVVEEAAGLDQRYHGAMQRVLDLARELETNPNAAAAQAGVYLLPMAFRKRTLFKMDFAEAVYISELRSAPPGHFSYRNVAYAMYEEVARKHPSMARYFRVSDVRQPVDLLKR